MSPDDRNSLRASTKTEVSNATMKIFDSNSLSTETTETQVSVHTRGQTSLKKFPRKNFLVHANAEGDEKKHSLHIAGIKSKSVILSAGAQDPLLVKNMISYRMLAAAHLSTLDSAYTELAINGHSEGLYMVTESPDDYLLKTLDADVVIRRRYNDVLELKKAGKGLSDEDVAAYQARLSEVGKILQTLKGEDLLAALSERLNMDHYMRWLAVNYLLKNSDYADEVFFFGAKKGNGDIYFDILPWDLDDTFEEGMHMSFIPGHFNFMKKHKSQSQMLYNFEAGIDRAISSDPVLLKKYFEVLAQVVSEITPDVVDHVINDVGAQLTPYLTNRDILENGKIDENKKAHDPRLVLADLEAKRAYLKERLSQMQSELQEIQNNPEDRSKKISAFGKWIGTKIMKIIQHFSQN
jgi:spore coat protein H